LWRRWSSEYLAHVGCRLLQGYNFARPMPPAKFEEGHRAGRGWTGGALRPPPAIGRSLM
jgi:predicted signal transduction protein with EAL and GGDEF domain